MPGVAQPMGAVLGVDANNVPEVLEPQLVPLVFNNIEPAHASLAGGGGGCVMQISNPLLFTGLPPEVVLPVI